MPEPSQIVCVGVISGAHGVRGMVKLQSFTDPPDRLRRYKVIVDKSGTPLSLESLSAAKDHFLARLTGVEDRDAAERLRGTELFVPRSSLPKPGKGEFYRADLIGMEARAPSGKILGTVKGVENFGASDILDIHGEGRRGFMVPFTDAFVPEVNVAARTVTIAIFEESE